MGRISGFINDPYSTLQPIPATAVLESGAVTGLSSGAVVKVTIPNLSVLKSVAVTLVKILTETIFPGGTGKWLAQVGNSIYFSTNLANDAIAGKTPVIEYVLSSEDFEIVKLNQVGSSKEFRIESADGLVTYRFIVRDGSLCKDVTLTELGFDGVKGVDWVNEAGDIVTPV